jgi:uncharacterized protein YndB with AHSA1/START domain
MPELPYSLERTVVIRAAPEIVFHFFTDSTRWAKWWGAGSTIDASPGGKVYIRHPNGVEVHGEIVAVVPLQRIVFTYGDASQVTISIAPDAAGTRLHLLHEFAEAAPRDLHVQGWRFQLSLFGNVTANEAFAQVQSTVDAWFAAWQIADAAERNAELARIAAPNIEFRDRYSLLDSAEDVSAHIAAALRFMPGVVLTRKGEIRHCQGTVLADWIAGPMSGTSVFIMNPDGRIASVTGLTNA